MKRCFSESVDEAWVEAEVQQDSEAGRVSQSGHVVKNVSRRAKRQTVVGLPCVIRKRVDDFGVVPYQVADPLLVVFGCRDEDGVVNAKLPIGSVLLKKSSCLGIA